MSFHPVEHVLGNLADFALAGRALERVAIGSDDATRRVLRVESSAGDLGIRLFGATRLHDGDVLFADEGRVVAVEIVADDVLIVRPRDVGEALQVAHAIGNRHAPLAVEDATARVRYAPALETLLQELGVPYERALR